MILPRRREELLLCVSKGGCSTESLFFLLFSKQGKTDYLFVSLFKGQLNNRQTGLWWLTVVKKSKQNHVCVRYGC